MLQAVTRSATQSTLNESPSEKEGKWCRCFPAQSFSSPLNESPSEKEGKYEHAIHQEGLIKDPQ